MDAAWSRRQHRRERYRGSDRVVEEPGARSEPPPGADGTRPVAQNRRARHDYDILDTVEAGIVLAGSEVKSLREGNVQLRDAYARVDDGEMWLYGVHVAPYTYANGFGAVDPDRSRKLLLHRRQIDELGDADRPGRR